MADLLSFEIDDLLPIVEGAALLGFVKVSEGDVEITPEGLEFSNAPILRQKELFRNAALEHVALLKQIKRALESKSDHTLPDDFFHDILDEHFTEEETLGSLRPRSIGGATRSCSITMRSASGSLFPKNRLSSRRTWKSEQRHDEMRRGTFALADPRPNLELSHGRDRVRGPVRSRLLDCGGGALLVQRAGGGSGDLAFARARFRATRSIRWCA